MLFFCPFNRGTEVSLRKFLIRMKPGEMAAKPRAIVSIFLNHSTHSTHRLYLSVVYACMLYNYYSSTKKNGRSEERSFFQNRQHVCVCMYCMYVCRVSLVSQSVSQSQISSPINFLSNFIYPRLARLSKYSRYWWLTDSLLKNCDIMMYVYVCHDVFFKARRKTTTTRV